MSFTASTLACAALMLAASVATAARPFPEHAWPRLRNGRQEWMDRADASLIVRWVRAEEPPQMEVRDGVCVLYYPDREEAFGAAESLVSRCIERGARADREPGPAEMRIHWHRRPDAIAVRDLWTSTYDVINTRSLVFGFYLREPDESCRIVTADTHRALGHELKHCFDGAFHAPSGRWYPRPSN